jgi:predicted transcriptional regulator
MSRKDNKSSVTEAELRVLEALWQRSAATMGQLRDELYPAGGESKFATVQKLLSRLAEKGLVRRRKDGSSWLFTPTAGREELIGDELRRVADRLGGKSMTPLLTYLVEAGQLNAKERAHLRQLLEDYGGTASKKR